MQTVAVKVNFPLFLFSEIYSSSLFSGFFGHDLLFHINALHREYLGCDVWTFQSCVLVPSGVLCKTPELRRCHEVWSTSRDSTPSAQHCPAGLPWHFVQENSPRQGEKCGGCLLYHMMDIILHNWCFFCFFNTNIHFSARLGGHFAFGNWNIDILV